MPSLNFALMLPSDLAALLHRLAYERDVTKKSLVVDALRLAYQSDQPKPPVATVLQTKYSPPDETDPEPERRTLPGNGRVAEQVHLREPDDQGKNRQPGPEPSRSADRKVAGSDTGGHLADGVRRRTPTKPPKPKQAKAKVRTPKLPEPDDDSEPLPPLTPLEELRADPYNEKGLDHLIWVDDRMGTPVKDIAAQYKMDDAEVALRLAIMNAPKPPPAYEHVWVDQMSPEETLKNQRWRKSG